jgi:hypothetical protein
MLSSEFYQDHIDYLRELRWGYYRGIQGGRWYAVNVSSIRVFPMTFLLNDNAVLNGRIPAMIRKIDPSFARDERRIFWIRQARRQRMWAAFLEGLNDLRESLNPR